jgi:hypothetical protein
VAGQPGSDGLAGYVAAGVSVMAGQNRAAATTASSLWRKVTMCRPLPHTIQLCIHCRHNPAGFWVSHNDDQTVRRPWCLSCQDLDPAGYHIRPFDLQYLR